MAVVEVIVVSGLPMPKANLFPTNAVPKSFALNGASPSTRPTPLYHCGEPLVCVVFTQKAMLKSLHTGLVICTRAFAPLNVRQAPMRPLAFQLAFVNVPVLLLPEESVASRPL